MNTEQKFGPALPGHQNTMPALIPIPIETKGKGFFAALWTWIKSTREWKFENDWDFYCSEIDETVVIPRDFEFDGASIPKRLRAYLSPVGLLLVPGIVHDFGYRYDYVWVRNEDGTVKKAHINAGREHWDNWFFTIGNHVNGVLIINFLATVALALGGWLAWRNNRRKTFPELEPEPIVIKLSPEQLEEVADI